MIFSLDSKSNLEFLLREWRSTRLFHAICIVLVAEVIGIFGPWTILAFEIPLNKQLPVTARPILFSHSIAAGSSLRVRSEGGPYVRAKVFLAPGVKVGDWGIEILDESGEIVEKISSKELASGIWTVQVWSPALRVKVPKNGARIMIEKRLLITDPYPVQNVIPRGTAPNFTPLDSHPDPEIRRAGKVVVHLRVMHGDEEKPCTGFLLSPTLVMTNEH